MTEGMEPTELAPDVSVLIRPTPIAHPDEFVVQLTGITAPWVKAWGKIRPWYRGMSKISFSLEPSLFRYRPKPFLQLESNLVNQFYSAGSRFFRHRPADELEMFAVMQHHGVPTRLLDWTENSFAALYFAVRDWQHFADTEDAVVWFLEPLRLNEIVRGERIIPYSGRHLLGPQLPVPMFSVHGSDRITTQRGAFTLHAASPQHSLAKLALKELEEGRPSFLHALRIKTSARKFIRDGLITSFGQGEFTLFPDLDGLARELRMREGLEDKG
jgi:hypothetical protein